MSASNPEYGFPPSHECPNFTGHNRCQQRHVQTCPKCQGQGIVSRPPWVPGDVQTWVGSQTTYTCDVCKGLKVLHV